MLKRMTDYINEHPGVVLLGTVYFTGVVTSAVISTTLTRGMSKSIAKTIATQPVLVTVNLPEEIAKLITSTVAS